MMRQNVRQPDETRGDLNAQIASLDIGERAVARLARKYGTAALTAAMAGDPRRLGSDDARRAQAAAGRRASFVELVDDDGQSEEPIRLAVKITKTRRDHRGRFLGLEPAGAAARSTRRRP